MILGISKHLVNAVNMEKTHSSAASVQEISWSGACYCCLPATDLHEGNNNDIASFTADESISQDTDRLNVPERAFRHSKLKYLRLFRGYRPMGAAPMEC